MTSNTYRYLVLYIAKWIIAMLNNENSCLKYLFMAMKSCYHSSNTGKFQEKFVEFFVDRIYW